MIAAEDLIALVRNYNPKTNVTRLADAYEFGKEMHEGQYRHSGEPYFTHPVAVAAILTEQRLDDATIITALAARHHRRHQGQLWRGDRKIR